MTQGLCQRSCVHARRSVQTPGQPGRLAVDERQPTDLSQSRTTSAVGETVAVYISAAFLAVGYIVILLPPTPWFGVNKPDNILNVCLFISGRPTQLANGDNMQYMFISDASSLPAPYAHTN